MFLTMTMMCIVTLSYGSLAMIQGVEVVLNRGACGEERNVELKLTNQ